MPHKIQDAIDTSNIIYYWSRKKIFTIPYIFINEESEETFCNFRIKTNYSKDNVVLEKQVK